MRNVMKQLGMGLGLLFSMGTASTALAYPPQCMDICSCASSCTAPCYQGTFRTTCSDEICKDYCRGTAPQASLSSTQEQKDAQEQQDASENVCSEQAEQSASVKS
ncbi:hypothetical protein [Vitiosangium sp. GDMCC 1.1324]|uniref:hypothetical protein n=1 Tax=Vitiosangium sp. (strain GDMCC 1.1324) TaxID=2138576 RepID=UPI000D3BC855|nr:hypothetical protein [Vitiosangium sp. GDMCC 1.1324]PTL79764.1 hypothetical protein DAT35_33760 [Vitiosangium sp. GDMCC 1.1324]